MVILFPFLLDFSFKGEGVMGTRGGSGVPRVIGQGASAEIW